MAMPYTNNKSIIHGRDPDTVGFASLDEVNRMYLLTSDIALAVAMDEPGVHVILDTEASETELILRLMT